MDELTDPKELQELLLDSLTELSSLSKALANQHRIHISALLIDGPKTFSDFLKSIQIQKTALANHLNQLLKEKVITKDRRGSYAITEDGRRIIQAIAQVYRDSTIREFRQREQWREKYTRSFSKESQTMKEKLVSTQGIYQGCWISYTGAISGVLKALGNDFNVSDVAGYTGYAFLFNVATENTCPSGSTAFSEKVWDTIINSNAVLGWELKEIGDGVPFPKKGPKPTPEDVSRAKKLFDDVTGFIDRTDRPVVLWGIPVPEYGIVNGYKGDSYLVSTFRTLHKEEETPIRYDAIQAPGCLSALVFNKKTQPITEKVDREAVQRAYTFAQSASHHPNYTVGTEAYEVWAAILEANKEGTLIYHGNSYVAACYQESKAMAAIFLTKLAEKYEGKPQAEWLKKAAAEYKHAAELMEEFVKLFPFKFEGEFPKEKRLQGAKILRKARPYEEAAIKHLESCLNHWKEDA